MEDKKGYNNFYKKLGLPQRCPVCGGNNPSGKELPAQCVWCNYRKNFKDDEHEQDMDPQHTKIKHLEEENYKLKQDIAKLIELISPIVEDIKASQHDDSINILDFIDDHEKAWELCEVYTKYKKDISS